ncbi:Imm32 family immunity protein [Leptospira kanakyensis]|uniref:Methylhydantoinase n=1 Tax=Leptospira kanakyensis TaxID=2484968 RepID=A0A6N4QCG1_9LEPT|nr:Imm32 family immunity protein [Leptospira kanakyensis]TGK45974.1 methylhydantoinase [Leptospira kanakyensis]TGK70614.1 methylhydantoinase [Leptospira kanakyensis]
MEYLLTFELENEELTIHGSPKGLQHLAQQLENLIKFTKKGNFDHIHLIEDLNLGLSSEKQSEKSELINHVKIYCWNN